MAQPFPWCYPTSNDSVGATVSVGAVNMSATGKNAGSIVCSIISRLLGMTVVGFIVAFILLLPIFSASKPVVTVSHKVRALLLYAPQIQLLYFELLHLCYWDTPSRLPDVSKTSGHASLPSVSIVRGPGMLVSVLWGAEPLLPLVWPTPLLLLLSSRNVPCIWPGPQCCCWWSTRSGWCSKWDPWEHIALNGRPWWAMTPRHMVAMPST